MAISDLAGTSWVFTSESLRGWVTELNYEYTNISITSNGNTYNRFVIVDDYDTYIYQLNYGETAVWQSTGWVNNNYRLITFVSGSDCTDAELIEFMEMNATQVSVTDLTGTLWELKPIRRSSLYALFGNTLAQITGTVSAGEYTTQSTSSQYRLGGIATDVTGDPSNYYTNSGYAGFYVFVGSNQNVHSGSYFAISQYGDMSASYNYFYDGTTKHYINETQTPIKFEITGGGSVASPDLILWFENNAQQASSNYTVTATLTNLTASPSIPETIAPDGTISTTLSPASGYGLPKNANVTVTGGTKSYNEDTGVLTVTALTGDVTITASAVPIYSVTATLTGVTSDYPIASTVRADGEINTTFTAMTGYDLPDSVTVTGGSYTYNKQTRYIHVYDITGNVTITVTGVAIEYTITYVTDGVILPEDKPTTITVADTETFAISSKKGYILPETITVTGASHTYDKTTGTVTISSPSANVIINIFGKVALTDMARNGGYQIVNFKGVSLTAGTGATISGVYNAIKNANGKRIVISGLVIGATAYNDLPVAVTMSSTSYIFNAYGYDFVITTADLVTATAEA